MAKTLNLFFQLMVFCTIITMINGCSSAGVFPIERSASDDPAVMIPYIPWDDPPINQPSPGEPVAKLQGSYVTFYTWQSNGNFVTKDEYYSGFEGLEPPWDYHMVTLDEFVSLYGHDVPLWSSTPWEGLTMYDPYGLDVVDLIMDPDMDPGLAALITPGMTKSEFFEAMKNYNRIEDGNSRKLSGSVKRSAARFDTYYPPTYNIGMDICDWVVEAGDVEWIRLFDLYYSHAALVGYPGNDQTADGPLGYYWPNGHPDRSGDQDRNNISDGYPDGIIDLWDATVYEAIGMNLNVAKDVGHYPYSRAFIEPGRDGIKEVSFNYSKAVWNDPNWLSIFMGIWNYAWTQNDCRWFYPQNKWNFGTPAWLGKKHTYCSLLVWQAYMYSTHFNAYYSRTYELDIDWDKGNNVLPGDLINSLNSYDAVEWNYWKR